MSVGGLIIILSIRNIIFYFTITTVSSLINFPFKVLLKTLHNTDTSNTAIVQKTTPLIITSKTS